jgi:dihydrofolate synthase/folylpolyglutamate synthase
VTATDWVASLSPWPVDGFGTERIHALMETLGHPELAYPSIHVVGTNGKSTATRTIAALLGGEGLRVGAYTSPHVSGWSERIQVDGRDVDFERAVAAVEARALTASATQFETLTAAALNVFHAEHVDVAVVEAGLGGRFDATNVPLRTRVVHLTNVGLEHTDVLGGTREQIAREKLAVVQPESIVVLGEPEWASFVPANEVRHGGAREVAEAFLGHALERGVEIEVSLPGRLERRGADEVRDGAHTPDGVAWLLAHLEPRAWTIVASILRDKDVDAMLELLGSAGGTLIATRSGNERALPEQELAARAQPYFDHVEAVADPAGALRRARELGGPVLVTGSLYLLADLHATS